MLFEEPKNFYEDTTVGKWTVIGKEDQEREDFGSGGGKVLWRKGEEVEKEAGKLAEGQQDETTDGWSEEWDPENPPQPSSGTLKDKGSES